MFIQAEIDPTPGLGFTCGPEFNTNIQTLANGRESRNAEWDIARHFFTLPFKNITAAQYRLIKRMHLLCRGRCHTFLQRDWGDFEAVDEPFGTGDGATLNFQLSKLSIDTHSGAEYLRVVTKPDAETVIVKVNGVPAAATVFELTGIVAFGVAPPMSAVLTWSGEFFVQVRFDNDKLPYSIDDKNAADFITNGTIDLIEVIGE